MIRPGSPELTAPPPRRATAQLKMKMKITVTDASGALVCVGEGKDGFTKASARFMRPMPAYKGQEAETVGDLQLYPFGICNIKTGMTTAEGTYSVIKANEEGLGCQVALYDLKKLSTLGFTMSVVNMEGTLVAKVAQPGMSTQKVVCELGAKVDVVAVALLTALVGAATGSGGGIGGAIGAGAI